MDLEKIEGLVKIIEDSSLNEFTYKDKDVDVYKRQGQESVILQNSFRESECR